MNNSLAIAMANAHSAQRLPAKHQQTEALPSGAVMLPSDVLAGFGSGNVNKGAATLSHAFGQINAVDDPGSSPVAWYLDFDGVREIGNGSHKKGRRVEHACCMKTTRAALCGHST